MKHREILKKHLELLKKYTNIPIVIKNIVYFHISHYHSMENICCHSNQSSNAPVNINPQRGGGGGGGGEAAGYPGGIRQF